MGSDLALVIQWWGTLFLVGAASYPLTKVLFGGWWDRGYLFSKAVGVATVTFLVYVFGTLRLLPFSSESIAIALAAVFVVGVLLSLKDKGERGDKGNRTTLLAEEALFFVALWFWAWIKAHEPSIHGLEKFMDFGFTQSALDHPYFPTPDMWYAGGTINYYYFGHIVMAVLTRLSGLSLRYTFNLMLATIFALTLTMSFSIGRQLWWREEDKGNRGNRGKGLVAGVLTAFLVTLGGNLQTIYAFTAGYSGDQVKPFWQLLWPLAEFGAKLPEGLNRYWYANATRFIPFTIHEFPSYSFVVSDVHGHVLSLPFVLLAIALLIATVLSVKHESVKAEFFKVIFYGFLVGVLLMTNALDGPVYFLLFLVLIFFLKQGDWSDKGIIAAVVAVAAAVASLPFLVHFQSFVHGLAVNCPPSLLANTRIGPFLFEGVEKCQHSPLWMMLLLWGFFIYCGFWLLAKFFNFKLSVFRQFINGKSTLRTPPQEAILVIFFIFSLILIIFPEFFYFKDIYPMHFRSNTMFKLGYQAFILFAIVSGYTIVRLIVSENKIIKAIFIIFLIPQLFLISIYPWFSVRSYFGAFKTYEGLDGLAWLERQYPDDYVAIEWLNKEAIRNMQYTISKTNPDVSPPVLVEADGDSYTDYARFSAFTGIPTIIGWPVHEWLWRGSYDVVAPRREEVRLIYEGKDLGQTKKIFEKYHVRYVVIGTLEREKYQNLNEQKFTELGREIFRSGSTVIYQIF